MARLSWVEIPDRAPNDSGYGTVLMVQNQGALRLATMLRPVCWKTTLQPNIIDAARVSL